MMNHKIVFFFVSFCFLMPHIKAQSISSKLIDEETKETIPFATILLNKTTDGTVSNIEGAFSIQFNKDLVSTDSLFISCMGYEEKVISATSHVDSIIYLKPKTFELNSVLVTNKVYTVDEIIDNVVDNFENNHGYTYAKKQLFLRESFHQRIKKFDLQLKKSTIAEITRESLDSVEESMPRYVEVYNESLFDVYENKEESTSKINITKMLLLEDESINSSFEDIGEKVIGVLSRNVKKGSYLKFKSGIIPLQNKVSVDSIQSEYKKDQEKESNEFDKEGKEQVFGFKKEIINNALYEVLSIDDSEIDIVEKHRKYKFTKEGHIDIGDNIAYIISFVPNGGADFIGKMYINMDDFAVLRIDVENSKPVFDKKFNMFGIHFNHLGYKNTVMFSKENNNYQIKYLKKEEIISFALNRPLKIIEKNKQVKGRRKQNEVSLDLETEMVGTITKEMIVNSNSIISKNEFESFKENKDFKMERLTKYDPSFWSGYNIIAPENAIKEFEISE